MQKPFLNILRKQVSLNRLTDCINQSNFLISRLTVKRLKLTS